MSKDSKESKPAPTQKPAPVSNPAPRPSGVDQHGNDNDPRFTTERPPEKR